MIPKKSSDTIPFFVVDRPMSLKLLDYCEIGNKKFKFGLMAHANTSKNFQQLFKNFAYDNVVKACDSGVFTKKGCLMDYKNLFFKYDQMGTEYGIMIDFLNDREKTLKSAKKALIEYKKVKHDFKLVAVAQGRTINEYLECYNDLKSLGFNHVAIGGLLKKQVNTARFVNVKSEDFLKEVLIKIRDEHKDDWLFALGCYNPKRHKFFREINLFGSDSKGWILNYKTPIEMETNAKKELIEIKSKIENLNSIKIHDKTESKNTSKIIKSLESEEKAKLKLIKKLRNMDVDEKRKYRFNQIKAYFYKNIYSLFKDNLLIISCSMKKQDIDNPAPAIKIYDGPYYKMIRKMMKEGKFKNIHIMIISSKYGLLGPYDLIEKYDQKINNKNIKNKKKNVNKQLNEFLKYREFNESLISMGKLYCASIENVNFGKNHKFVEGGIGIKLSQTKKWVISKDNEIE